MNDKININPLVSIIIPTYRQDNYFKKALYSALSQTYSNIEIIVVDDNYDLDYSDRVMRAVLNFSDSRIIYIKNTDNLGSAKTRNIGISNAKGEFITFLDDDDEYHSEKIYIQLNKMIEGGYDFGVTNMELVNNHGVTIGYRERKQIYKCNSLFNYHMMYHLTGTSTMMFRRDFLLRIGMFDSIDIGDEFYLIHKAIQVSNAFIHVNSILVKALIHNSGEGLSLGNKRLNGENELYSFKKKFFHKLSFFQRQFIKMRHFLVISRIHLKNRKYVKFIAYLLYAFISNPIGFIEIIIRGI